jgi:hypothetical protein
MMRELFIAIMIIIGLYVMGRFFYPDEIHRPIEQELIKGDEE